MEKQPSNEEQVHRWVLAIEELARMATIARGKNVSLAAVCRAIGVNPNTRSQRKSGQRGVRGLPANHVRALTNAGVDPTLFTDWKMRSIQAYMPAEVPKTLLESHFGKRRTSRATQDQVSEMRDELTEIRNEIADLHETCRLLIEHLKVESSTLRRRNNS